MTVTVGDLPGGGVVLKKINDSDARELRLVERRDGLRSRIRWTNRFRGVLFLIGVVFALITLMFGLSAVSINRTMSGLELRLQSASPSEASEIQKRLGQYDAQYDTMFTEELGGVILTAPFLVLCTVVSPRASQNELMDTSNELDLISIPSISYEQKAQKLLQMQQLELKRYYTQTLHQSAYIFWVGVIDMIIGIAVIVGTIYYVHSWGEADITEKMIVAVVGAVGGVLTNFVGVMYIKMFSEIVKGVTHSYDALVTMNHLHLANLFVADISDQNLREKTLAELALAMKMSLTRPSDSIALVTAGATRPA